MSWNRTLRLLTVLSMLALLLFGAAPSAFAQTPPNFPPQDPVQSLNKASLYFLRFFVPGGIFGMIFGLGLRASGGILRNHGLIDWGKSAMFWGTVLAVGSFFLGYLVFVITTIIGPLG